MGGVSRLLTDVLNVNSFSFHVFSLFVYHLVYHQYNHMQYSWQQQFTLQMCISFEFK